LKKILSLIAIIWWGCSTSLAQLQLPMQNGIFRACTGVFEGSGNGQTAGHYDHNEDLITTICVPGAVDISWDFKRFCSEKDFDYLKIYLGKDTNGSLLGTYSGTQSPGKFTVNDSCITFYFHSDKSVSCTGWEAEWNSKVVYLAPPSFTYVDSIDCESTEISIQIDQKIHCDSIRIGDFQFSGPVGANITQIQPLNCDQDTFATQFKLTLSQPLDRSGSYNIDIRFRIADLCDSLWIFDVKSPFSITNCPIDVSFEFDDTLVCLNSCIPINAIVTGGNPTLYMYNWIRGGLIGAGPFVLCITQDTLLVLEVSDGFSPADRDSVWIRTKPLPRIQADTSVCESSTLFRLAAYDTGGNWYGPGIQNQSGDFLASAAGPGSHIIWYEWQGCADSLRITVLPMRAGPTQAACPGSAPFSMVGFTPSGGFWSGQHIDSNGLFNPQEMGSFRVYYHWNGCIASKWVNVDSISIKGTDTSCLNDLPKNMVFSPIGGLWSGAGIANTRLGTFNPAIALAGDKTLIYRINGCTDTTFMHVVDIDAGPTQLVCPAGGKVLVQPPPTMGGEWVGNFLSDSIGQTFYNPITLAPWQTDTLFYSIAKCTDYRLLLSVVTQLDKDSLALCPANLSISLSNPLVNSLPANGIWSGPFLNGNVFSLASAPNGFYTAYYEANQCIDSIQIHVLPSFSIQKDTSVCFNDYQIPLWSSDSLGAWYGQGIQNNNLGLFNPKQAGIGNKELIFVSQNGCKDTLLMQVSPLPNIIIDKSKTTYCVIDSLFLLQALPDTGYFWGEGVSNRRFNPKLTSQNPSRIYYSVGQGVCRNTDSFDVQIRPSLKVKITSDKDSFCKFDQGILKATASGGDSFSYMYYWSSGQVGTSELYVFPDQTQQVVVFVDDACSDVTSDTIELKVNPPPSFTINSSAPLCPGEIGFIALKPSDNKLHSYRWKTAPPKTTDSILLIVGATYYLTATDIATGCTKDTGIYLPSSEGVLANFRLNSPRPCIAPFSTILPILDQSIGGTKGMWHVNGAQVENYVSGTNPQLPYLLTGDSIKVSLYIENEQGCADSFIQNICVIDTVYIHIPTAFSPNNDGINDVFSIKITEVRKFEASIYNRWGELLYQTNDPSFEWDGTYQNQVCPEGYYAYKINYWTEGYYVGKKSGTFYLLK
jgi:gliding motility-associated-like protein